MVGEERFLITGAGGCIGAWAVHELLGEGTDVVAFDVTDDLYRLRLLLDEDALSPLKVRQGDIRDFDTVASLVVQESITHIVHLAALQVPFCFADPVLGSQVNVTGTVNVLEAARRSDGGVQGISYASSVAVFGPGHLYDDDTAYDDSPLAPATLYGGYKQANEWNARVYAADWGIGAFGLRPSIVYGPGRDQGLTSDPSKAMLAAAVGSSGHIAFGGSATFQHAQDAAATFIAAARENESGAPVHNIGGPTWSMVEVADAIEAAAPGCRPSVDEDTPLAVPGTIDGSALDARLGIAHRPMDDGINDSIERFRALHARGLIEVP